MISNVIACLAIETATDGIEKFDWRAGFLKKIYPFLKHEIPSSQLRTVTARENYF